MEHCTLQLPIFYENLLARIDENKPDINLYRVRFESELEEGSHYDDLGFVKSKPLEDYKKDMMEYHTMREKTLHLYTLSREIIAVNEYAAKLLD